MRFRKFPVDSLECTRKAISKCRHLCLKYGSLLEEISCMLLKLGSPKIYRFRYLICDIAPPELCFTDENRAAFPIGIATNQGVIYF